MRMGILQCLVYSNQCEPHIERSYLLFQPTALPVNCSCKRMFSSRIQQNVQQNVLQRPVRSSFRDLKRNEGIGPVGWFLLLIPVSTFGLGTWQIKRKKWKENLIESLMVKTREPAVQLPEEDSEVSALEYRKVRVRGKFDHAGEMYLGPRSLLLDGESAYHGKLVTTSANKSSGYQVVTPFILSESKERILVNRGWVALKNKNPRTRLHGQINEEVELEGVVRLSEPRQPFTPLNKLDARIWFSRDVEEMAKFVDCRPVFIDVTADFTVEGGPIGGQTRATFRNEHLSYILTWYGISLGTSFLWYKKFIR
uniref:SURF1-like protein n=1 Tax=Rhodnius prolixus TaxID=13249 RepID=R4G3N1_RHOPR